jgi:hypothetical protein
MNAASRYLLFCLIIPMIIFGSSSARGQGSDADSYRSARKQEQALLVEWVKLLKPETDYNGTKQWTTMFGSKDPETFFNGYSGKFSKIAEKIGAFVNFVSIGACDGSNDETIEIFLANSHWKGVFVEPMSDNFADLTNFLSVNGVANRSTTIKGAATAECVEPYLEMKKPGYGKEEPHWKRRQIGSILQDGEKKLDNWTTEKVSCSRT